MRAIVKKWGNSAAIRVPAVLMNAAKLELDDAVEVREEGGRIIIEPVRQRRYELAQLIAGITPRNQHGAVDFGPPLGKEVL